MIPALGHKKSANMDFKLALFAALMVGLLRIGGLIRSSDHAIL